jgi:hypothetical protein
MGRRRTRIVCPVERCGRTFDPLNAAAAATHQAAAHVVCSCGWVGVRYPSHRTTGPGHRRLALVKLKEGNGGAPKPAPTARTVAPPPPPIDVAILDRDLDDYISEIHVAADRAHAEYHWGVEYAADWGRCWYEPCRTLTPLADRLEVRLESARAGSSRRLRAVR